jgi:hypothetical protein
LEGELEGLTEGRIVHWVDEDGLHNAAIVIDVVHPDRGMAGLTVFRRSGEITVRDEDLFDETTKLPGTWHWPERA